ncbi:alpha-glucan family phosphorylase [Lacihabitans sp. LS3-19]|nr:alpha-glucan family phosphorylase [Lacihabitans sp. LS3-19]
MEFAIDQALKTYSGGLGFLAGSHMRSAHELNQNLIGVGILWKFGYYEQQRNTDNSLRVFFREQMYSFLIDTEIRFQINIKNRPVWVATYYLPSNVFGSAPMFFMTTDTDGNDEWARSISYHLYDKDPEIKAAQCMLLGIGGATFLDKSSLLPEIYHFNEAHAVSAVFYFISQNQTLDQIKNKVVFTTHTPEEAGNEKHDFGFLNNLGFFCGLNLNMVAELSAVRNNVFNHTLAALRFAKRANGVSKLHGEVSRQMWGKETGICKIGHITNAQNSKYWTDDILESFRKKGKAQEIAGRKKELKKELFKVVADQVGKIFDPEKLTIVWARRFAAYKRPDLITRDIERFEKLMKTGKVQIIWAGKPYPYDFGAIDTFNRLYYLSHLHKNMAVLTGYELALSKLMKDGSDVWLNNPVVTREASGTSGMTAAMNGSINLTTYDGWVCEFSNNENSFIAPVAKANNDYERDVLDMNNILDLIENEIIPKYYDKPKKWNEMVLNSMNDVSPFFDSDRMADEYYKIMYNPK